MRKYLLKFAALLALLMALFQAAPAQAAYNWGPTVTANDCAGNGCLTVYYRIRTDYSVGFYLEGVKISSGGGINLAGIDGKGASCWNDNNVIQWSKDGSQTNLGNSDSTFWDTEISMPNTSTLTCGWTWEENYYTGQSLFQCAKVKLWHLSEQDGGC